MKETIHIYSSHDTYFNRAQPTSRCRRTWATFATETVGSNRALIYAVNFFPSSLSKLCTVPGLYIRYCGILKHLWCQIIATETSMLNIQHIAQRTNRTRDLYHHTFLRAATQLSKKRKTTQKTQYNHSSHPSAKERRQRQQNVSRIRITLQRLETPFT